MTEPQEVDFAALVEALLGGPVVPVTTPRRSLAAVEAEAEAPDGEAGDEEAADEANPRRKRRRRRRTRQGGQQGEARGKQGSSNA
ncbi:MAG: hypothetical protein KC620_00710 [Myxococcales bacterium]|nr:hypothetical protein [Myxococcales bacterium]